MTGVLRTKAWESRAAELRVPAPPLQSCASSSGPEEEDSLALRQRILSKWSVHIQQDCSGARTPGAKLRMWHRPLQAENLCTAYWTGAADTIVKLQLSFPFATGDSIPGHSCSAGLGPEEELCPAELPARFPRRTLLSQCQLPGLLGTFICQEVSATALPHMDLLGQLVVIIVVQVALVALVGPQEANSSFTEVATLGCFRDTWCRPGPAKLDFIQQEPSEHYSRSGLVEKRATLKSEFQNSGISDMKMLSCCQCTVTVLTSVGAVALSSHGPRSPSFAVAWAPVSRGCDTHHCTKSGRRENQQCNRITTRHLRSRSTPTLQCPNCTKAAVPCV
ncbi:hypothetical protein H920_01015 [Fukomys damarensis]|uniref:Uncharacterized protein n=1 Tax=Fukomys damarensis TaxID=885580 RepID=A0A091E4L6_FUKDA|nr:hypothetical protein H920_01015 [Fukomys damarensis]